MFGDGIGSFPDLDTGKACDLILETLPEIPLWPQLSKTDFREQMESQYSEGFPCIVLDEAKSKMIVDTSGDPTCELEKPVLLLKAALIFGEEPVNKLFVIVH